MSLILDALKRAERERQAGPGQPLGGTAMPAPRRPARIMWVLGLVALLAIGAAVAWSFRGSRVPEPVPATPATLAANRVPAPATAQAPPVESPPSAPPAYVPPVVLKPQQRASAPPAPAPAPAVIPGTEDVASLDDVAEEEAPLEELVPAAEPELEPEPDPDPVPEEEEATEEPGPAEEAPPPPPATPAPAAPATPTPAPATPARPVPKALTQAAPYRRFREMTPEYRADFPALTVEVHVYEPGRRFVMINGRRYQEGERLAEGPQVLEIVRDGIVMDYRGEKVLYPINR